jgi:iron complex outermembrane receptor protein
VWSSLRWGALVLCASLALTNVARADVRTEARQHFRHGMALIAEGQLDAGIAELVEAYDILPHPNALYNIARAYSDAGRYTEAIDYYHQYLESDPADREEVQQFVTALQQRIAQREGRTQVAETTTTTTTETPTTTATPVASDDEIRALTDSATQIEALAEAAQSDELRHRAERLRALAASLRERESGTPTETTAETTADTTSETETAETTTETTAEGQEAEVPATLELAGHEADVYEESVVSSSRVAESPLNAPNSTATVTAQDLRMSGYTNPAFALRRVAGVSIMATDPADPQISIRGFNQRLSNRTIVLVDGRSVYLDFIGVTLWNLIPVNMEDIERIEVIRGPASALYGADAFTGVINIITRTLGDGGSYVSGGVGSNGIYRLAAGASGHADRWRFRVSGGYERGDNYSLNVDPSRVDYTARPGSTQGFDRLYFGGDAQVRLDGGWGIRGGVAVSEGSMNFQAIANLRQLDMRGSIFSQSYIQVTSPVGLSARVFWNRFAGQNIGSADQLNGGIAQTQNTSVNRSDMIDVELMYNTNFDLGSIHNHLIAGVGYRFKQIDWNWLRDGIQTQNHGAVFLQDTLAFSDDVSLVLSVRGDLHPLLNVQVSPRGSLVIHPAAGNTIRFAVGSAFRSPTFTESYVLVPQGTPFRGVTAFGSGNPSMNPERIVSGELGYMNQMTDYFTLEFNAYYNLVFDLITLTQNQIFRLTDYTNGNSIAGTSPGYDPTLNSYVFTTGLYENSPEQFQQAGGEVGARVYPVDGLDLYANYALSYIFPFGGAQGPYHSDQRTSAHMVNAGFQYRAPFGLDIATDFSWQSSQVWFEQQLDPVRGIVFQNFPLPDYITLNARIGWRFLDDQLELAVVGYNLAADGHREHPYGQTIPRRFMGTVTVRF